MSLLDQATLVVTPNGFKASKQYSVIPNSGSGDMSSVRATTASRVKENGIIESVANNVPRIDNTTGVAVILVERQSTNLFNYSEDLTNAVWVKSNSSITPNVITAPDGTLTADKFVENNLWNTHYYKKDFFTLTNGTTYTGSVFLKKGGRNYATIKTFDGGGTHTGNTEIIVDLINGTIIGGDGVGNVFYNFDGWIGVEVTFTALSTVTTAFVFRVHLTKDNILSTYQGDGVSGMYVWGHQFEIGDRTSYIKTPANATITRNVDIISKSGLIGNSVITETFLDNTTNVITNANTYTMSEGKIKYAIRI